MHPGGVHTAMNFFLFWLSAIVKHPSGYTFWPPLSGGWTLNNLKETFLHFLQIFSSSVSKSKSEGSQLVTPYLSHGSWWMRRSPDPDLAPPKSPSWPHFFFAHNWNAGPVYVGVTRTISSTKSMMLVVAGCLTAGSPPLLKTAGGLKPWMRVDGGWRREGAGGWRVSPAPLFRRTSTLPCATNRVLKEGWKIWKWTPIEQTIDKTAEHYKLKNAKSIWLNSPLAPSSKDCKPRTRNGFEADWRQALLSHWPDFDQSESFPLPWKLLTFASPKVGALQFPAAGCNHKPTFEIIEKGSKTWLSSTSSSFWWAGQKHDFTQRAGKP